MNAVRSAVRATSSRPIIRPGIHRLLPGAIGIAVITSSIGLLPGLTSARAAAAPVRGGTWSAALGIHNIQHVIVIMQENRSFDNYFGTYPGADGIPMSNGVPTACVPSTESTSCVRPYYDVHDIDGGGPHATPNEIGDVDGGAMDGFLVQAERAWMGCFSTDTPACREGPASDVMGYHDSAEVPNYWTYAKDYVLQDHMFESETGWSLAAHEALVSGWVANCASASPTSCRSDPSGGQLPPDFQFKPPYKTPSYPWTDLTWLLHKDNVSWKYYVETGTEPDCEDPSDLTCAPVIQNAKTPGIWNPLPYFTDVTQDSQTGNIVSTSNFYSPGSAPATGGATVTLHGEGFTGATAVTFGTVPAASFTVVSDNTITAVAPPHPLGGVYVQVTTPKGTSPAWFWDNFFEFTGPPPTVTSLSPSHGLYSGGYAVTLTGSGFTGATGVSFGQTAALSFTVVDDSTITAVAPAGPPGGVYVTVVTANGRSAISFWHNFFDFRLPPPSVTSLSPATGPKAGGYQITITGTNLTRTQRVLFGATAAPSFTVVSGTTIIATVPAAAADGPVWVTVVTPAGRSAPNFWTSYYVYRS